MKAVINQILYFVFRLSVLLMYTVPLLLLIVVAAPYLPWCHEIELPSQTMLVGNVSQFIPRVGGVLNQVFNWLSIPFELPVGGNSVQTSFLTELTFIVVLSKIARAMFKFDNFIARTFDSFNSLKLSSMITGFFVRAAACVIAVVLAIYVNQIISGLFAYIPVWLWMILLFIFAFGGAFIKAFSGKSIGVALLSALPGAVFELVLDLIAVALIYVTVMCYGIFASPEFAYISGTDLAFVAVSMVACMLGITLIYANTFTDTLGKFFKK